MGRERSTSGSRSSTESESRLVRFTINWNQVEQVRGKRRLGECRFGSRRVCSDHGIAPSLRCSALHAGQLRPTPSWAPTSGTAFAAFAPAAANRYPFVLVVARSGTSPTNAGGCGRLAPRTYVTRLLNPAYAAINKFFPGGEVGGGVYGAARLDRRRLSPALDPRHGCGG